MEYLPNRSRTRLVLGACAALAGVAAAALAGAATGPPAPTAVLPVEVLHQRAVAGSLVYLDRTRAAARKGDWQSLYRLGVALQRAREARVLQLSKGARTQGMPGETADLELEFEEVWAALRSTAVTEAQRQDTAWLYQRAFGHWSAFPATSPEGNSFESG
jgi:hypothetical protein